MNGGTVTEMKHPLQLATGIGVFVTSLLTLEAFLKTILSWPRLQTMPLISIISLGITALAIVLSLVGCYILVLGTNKPE
jgi:ABC-type long-subunit fatty acid transport system fused permease/ATPase subunit